MFQGIKSRIELKQTRDALNLANRKIQVLTVERDAYRDHAILQQRDIEEMRRLLGLTRDSMNFWFERSQQLEQKLKQTQGQGGKRPNELHIVVLDGGRKNET